MIEEFMLLANQCAAHFARVKQIPFVYRVHEEPNGEKLERLHALLQACGINDHFAKEVPNPFLHFRFVWFICLLQSVREWLLYLCLLAFPKKDLNGRLSAIG
jgi:hypothetical protein